MTWKAPAPGGSPITEYVLESTSDGGSTWQQVAEPDGAATTATVSD